MFTRFTLTLKVQSILVTWLGANTQTNAREGESVGKGLDHSTCFRQLVEQTESFRARPGGPSLAFT